MHELALYRKYRPETWKDVVGQDHIVGILESSVKSKKVSHAYLFVGGRGTGKTSVARIFARAIGVGPSDLYEIDAASNRGIDDIRTLREGVRALPFDSEYKAYIIDEVHMLSRDAWAALLKTLEEPPAHVIFILATTELEKVPDTIISRCQMFTFRKPSEAVLKKVIMDIAKAEGFDLEPAAAELVAILGDGSFRDAEGILQKVLNFSKGSKKISRSDAEKITGAPKTALVDGLLAAIAHKDLEEGIRTVQKASHENLDMKLYLKLVIEKLRAAVILRYAPRLEAEMAGDLSEADAAFLKSLIKEDSDGMLRSEALARLLDAYLAIDRAFVPELPLEMALVKIIAKE